MGGDVVGAMNEQEFMLIVPIKKRGGVGMLALCVGVTFAVVLPYLAAGGFVQRKNEPRIAVYQLKVKPIAIEEGRRRHHEVELEASIPFLQIGFPDLVALKVVTGKVAGADKCPDMLTVGGRGRGCRISLSAADDTVASSQDAFPKDLSVGADAQKHQVIPFG
jgi:hypothetical protein